MPSMPRRSLAAAGGGPRDKFTAIADMLAAAAAPTPPVRRRLLAGLLR